MTAYLFKSGTKNNGKTRDRAQHQHNFLKGVWTRVVKPKKPMDKALKKIKNQSRKTIRQADRSAEADARGRARVKVEKANKKANLDAAAFGACLQLEVTKKFWPVVVVAGGTANSAFELLHSSLT